MPKSRANKSAAAMSTAKGKARKKAAAKIDTSGMALDHDVKIPKGFPLK